MGKINPMKKITTKKASESQEQQRLIIKLRWFHPDLVFFAVPNGGKRGKGEARIMSLEGVEKGTPDIFIAEALKGYHGLFIELKRAHNQSSKVSIEQDNKIKDLELKGYLVKVCYGAEEAYREILGYIDKDVPGL